MTTDTPRHKLSFSQAPSIRILIPFLNRTILPMLSNMIFSFRLDLSSLKFAFDIGGRITAFAVCCFCIAANRLVFTSPMKKKSPLKRFVILANLPSHQFAASWQENRFIIVNGHADDIRRDAIHV